MEAHDGGGRSSNFDISHAAATYYTDFASLGIGRASPSLSGVPAQNGPCCNVHNFSTASPAQSPHNMPFHNQYNHSHIHQNGHHQNNHHSHQQMTQQQSTNHPYLSHQKSRRRGSSVVSDQSSYEFLYAEVKSSGSGKKSGNGLLGGALACLCRPKDSSSYSSSNPAAEALNCKQLTAGVEDALLQQSRLQMEALAATEETRDMWEWQMEQQQALAMAEHEFLEKRYSCASASAASASPLYELARSSSSARRSSASSLRGGAVAGALLIETLSRNASLRVQGISASQINNHQPNQASHINSQTNAQMKNLSRGSMMNDPDSPMSSTTPSTSSSAASGSGSGGGGAGGVPEITICRHHLTDPDFLSAATLLFEAALLRCRSEINVFCRIYMQQMVLSGHGLIKTLMDMEPETVFCRKVHASYALESRICSVMFRNFENDSFNDSGLTQILDQEARAVARLQEYLAIKGLEAEEALAVNSATYDAAFHHFCAGKSEEVAAMFGWTLSYRSAAERDRFMDAFLRAAKCVWMLHRLANSTNPPMQIIRVGRGMEMHPLYVEPVIALPPNSSNNNSSNSNSSSLNNRTHHHHSSNSSSSSSQYHNHHHPTAAPTLCPNCPLPKVEFMIMPGFVAPKCIFKAKVYQHFVCKSACTPHHLL